MSKQGSKLGKFFPFLILVGVLILGVFLWKGCSEKVSKETIVEKESLKNNGVTEKIVDKEVKTVKKTEAIEEVDALYNFRNAYLGRPVKGYEYLGEYVSRTLANGTVIHVLSKGFESQLIDFIESDKEVDKTTWFNLRRILFKTGSANLDVRSTVQIGTVTDILKAYPNVELKLGGYTDNTGNINTNKKISDKRAAALLNALVVKGIDISRLKSEGYGVEHPIADNKTKEGRALNRRVSARVTKK